MLPKAFNRLRTLSLEFTNPSNAFRLMRDFMEKSIENTKANAVRDTIAKFNKKGVVLKDVNDTAMSLTFKMKNGLSKEIAIEKIKKTVMKVKTEDIRRKCVITKSALKISKQNLSEVVRVKTFARKEFMKVVKNENERIWSCEKAKGLEKLNANFAKQKRKADSTLGVTQGVNIGDIEIECYRRENDIEIKENEAIVYDDIEVNDEEKEILKLPPDHALYPKVTVEKVETEMDVCFVKYNWEKSRKEREKEERNKVKDENNSVHVTLATDDGAHFSAHKKNSSQKENEICSKNVGVIDEENCSNQVTLAADDVADFQAHKKKVRFSNVKAHEWKNKRVIITELVDDSFEMNFNFMKKELCKETEKYISQFGDNKGNPKNRNLTKKQEKGIKELRRRVESENLSI